MRHTTLLILAFLSFTLSAFAYDLGAEDYSQISPEIDIAPGPEEPVVDPIMRYIDYGVKAATIVLGLLWLFLGYRLIRVVLFLAGFATFFVIVFFILLTRVTMAIWLLYVIAAGSGVIGGLLFVALAKLGYFLFGFIVGVLLSVIIISATPIASLFASGLIPLIIVLCTGVVVAIVTVIWSRVLLIIGTSFSGSILIATTLDQLFYGSEIANFIPQILRNISSGFTFTSTWQVYLILAGIVLVAIVGIVVQFRFTSRGYTHGKEERKEDEYPLLIQANV